MHFVEFGVTGPPFLELSKTIPVREHVIQNCIREFNSVSRVWLGDGNTHSMGSFIANNP